MAALNQAIDRFQHNASKAADEKHPEQLVKRHALREVRLLPFAVVNLRVGRRRRQKPQLLFLSAEPLRLLRSDRPWDSYQ